MRDQDTVSSGLFQNNIADEAAVQPVWSTSLVVFSTVDLGTVGNRKRTARGV
jgi:hypothetical protein